MCGIGALLDPAGSAPADAGRRMTAALRHRGPDGDGVRRSARRRSSTPAWRSSTSRAATSRSISEDGAVTRDRQRRDLQPPRAARASSRRRATASRPRSDCEVVVHGYEEHGDGLRAPAERDLRLRALGRPRERGWSPRATRSASSRSTGARDGRRVALASEVGALLAAGLVEPRVDRVALDHYLACRFVPAPRTLFDGRLEAAARVAARRRARTGRPRDHELPRGARAAARRASPGRRARRRARGPLHRRGRAPDDVRRPLRRLPQRRRRLGGDRRRDGAALRRAPATFTIGFPGHGDVLDEREYAAAVGAS